MEQIAYCPKCESCTVHVYVEDDIFDFAFECMSCNTIWEYDEAPEEYVPYKVVKFKGES